MKEITGERLYENIQYFWVYRKGYPIDELKKYLGPRYTEYQSLPGIRLVPNRIVREYAILLKTSVSRLRMQNKNRNSKIDAIKKIRLNKYNLSKDDGFGERVTSFSTSVASRSNKVPKLDTTSRKWNDSDARKFREFLEDRRKNPVDENEFDRGAMK